MVDVTLYSHSGEVIRQWKGLDKVDHIDSGVFRLEWPDRSIMYLSGGVVVITSKPFDEECSDDVC